MRNNPDSWVSRQLARGANGLAGLRRLGPRDWARYVAATKLARLGPRRGVGALGSPDAAHPLLFRRGSSDPKVFGQIFVAREYSCLDHLTGVGLVVDCGANVGYSSAYFLTRFPACRVVAVEPDPANFALLERNLAPYGDRATAVRSGVWSHACELVASGEGSGAGREWARRVRPCRPGEVGQMTAVDVGALIDRSGFGRASILKVDVEGAEAAIFGGDPPGWVGRCDAIVIELHDAAGAEAFFRAVAPERFRVSRCGELTVCTRPGDRRDG